jgi:hypothetical protein
MTFYLSIFCFGVAIISPIISYFIVVRMKKTMTRGEKIMEGVFVCMLIGSVSTLLAGFFILINWPT